MHAHIIPSSTTGFVFVIPAKTSLPNFVVFARSRATSSNGHPLQSGCVKARRFSTHFPVSIGTRELYPIRHTAISREPRRPDSPPHIMHISGTRAKNPHMCANVLPSTCNATFVAESIMCCACYPDQHHTQATNIRMFASFPPSKQT